MRKVLALLIAVAVIVNTKAQTPPLITKTFSGSVVNYVDAGTSGGNILVAGVSDGFKAELYAVPNNSNEKGLSVEQIKERLANNYELKFEVENNKFIAQAKPKRNNMNWKKGLSISFKIYVPQNVSTDLATSGGNIELSNLKGKQEFATSGGNLVVTGLSGEIDGTTSGGNIVIENSNDNINMTTSGGNVEAKHCTGKISLTTSGGNIIIDDLKGDIKASTSGGNVTGQVIEGELNAGTSGGNISLSNLLCSVDAATSGGDINVSVAKLSKHIKLTNSGGNIKLELPQNSSVDLNLYADKIKTETLQSFSGRFEEEKVEGKLNGGGIPVTIRADGGKIELGFK